MIKEVFHWKNALWPRFIKAANIGRIREQAADIRGSTREILESAKKERRHETFEEAVARLNLTPEKLEKRRRELLIESRCAYAFAALCLAMGCYYAATGALLGVLAVCALVFLGCVQGLTRAFRVHQIDERQFMSFQDFLARSDAWIQ